jgi:hypothetical protein
MEYRDYMLFMFLACFGQGRTSRLNGRQRNPVRDLTNPCGNERHRILRFALSVRPIFRVRKMAKIAGNPVDFKRFHSLDSLRTHH